MEVITYIGQVLMVRAILLMVIIGGIVWAAVRWKKHPRVSLLTIIGLAFYLIENSAFSLIFRYLPSWLISLGVTPNNIGLLDSLLQLVNDFAFTIVLIFLVAAALSGRTLPPATNEGTTT